MKALSDKDKKILALLEDYPQGAYLRQIQKFVHIEKKEYAFYYVRKLMRKGLVEERGRRYFLVRVPSDIKPSRVQRDSYHQISTRVHSWGLEYPLKDYLDPRQPASLFELAGYDATPISLNYNTQGQVKIGHITVRLTTRALFLYSKDIYTDNRTVSIDTEAALKHEFDIVALRLEAKLGEFARVRLLRLDKNVLESHIIKQHYAEEHHPMAEASPTSPLILARSPIDKQKSLGVDQSKGFREWEFYHHLTADTDKDAIDSQFNGVLDRKIDLWQLPFLMEQYGRQSEMLTQYARQIELHLRVMQKIDKKLSQKRLFE